MPGQRTGPRSKRAVLIKLHRRGARRHLGDAAKIGLPVAVLMRRLALGYLPKTIVDSRTLLELIRLKGDLGRIGGVLKMWLVDKPGAGAPETDVRKMLRGTG